MRDAEEVAQGLIKCLRNAVLFDRMAAIELRRFAEHERHIAEELCRIADKLDQDADEMTKHLSQIEPRITLPRMIRPDDAS